MTCYDRSGRVELSAATTANWVAKTANLLVDDLDVAPGEPVAVLALAHWQTAVLLLGCWTAGALVDRTGAAGRVAFVGPDAPPPAADEVIRLALLPVGGAVQGIADFAEETRRQPDVFHPAGPLPPETPALRLTGEDTWSTADLAGRADAGSWGLTATDRVLTTLGFDTLTGIVGGLLTPVATGASLVLHPAGTAAQLSDAATAERATASLGADVAGLRRLDG